MPDSLIGGEGNRTLRDAIQEGTLQYTYKGLPCWKDPFDLAIYSALLWRERPRTIIEIGTAHGGSALWFRDQMDLVGRAHPEGFVWSVDISLPARCPIADGLYFVRADAHHLANDFPLLVPDKARPLLVIEDSSHEPETTLAVMRYFDAFLRPGEMIVIEDGNADELYPGRHKRGGPLAAIADFMAERGTQYQRASEYCDMYGFNTTWNYDGYWRKIA